jgi:hypothetical protein
LYCWVAAVGFIALASVWSVRGEAVEGAAVVSHALAWISWAGGTAAWVAARNVEADEARLGLVSLAALRGTSPREFSMARVAATTTLVARAVGLPALVLALCAGFLGRASGGGIAVVKLAGAVLLYAVLFGVAFGGVARLSSRVSPRHGRIVFIALVLGPELLRGLFGDVPTLVSGFANLIDLVTATGSAAA